MTYAEQLGFNHDGTDGRPALRPAPLNMKDAAARAGCTEENIRLALKSKRLRGKRNRSGTWSIEIDDLDRWDHWRKLPPRTRRLMELNPDTCPGGPEQMKQMRAQTVAASRKHKPRTPAPAANANTKAPAKGEKDPIEVSTGELMELVRRGNEIADTLRDKLDLPDAEKAELRKELAGLAKGLDKFYAHISTFANDVSRVADRLHRAADPRD